MFNFNVLVAPHTISVNQQAYCGVLFWQTKKIEAEQAFHIELRVSTQIFRKPGPSFPNLRFGVT